MLYKETYKKAGKKSGQVIARKKRGLKTFQQKRRKK